MPQVSVLMAVYNAETWLSDALDSMLNQTYGDWELLAVDDGSTDASLSVLERYALKDSRIRVIHKEENEGLSVARNVGLAEARGEYICILDADDWFSPHALEWGVRGFRQAEDVDCVVFRLVEHERDQEIIRHEPLPPGTLITGDEAFRLSLDWQLHGLFLIRTEIHRLYPYDTTLRLYGDDNTVRLHYLHSRRVAFSKGEYHYRKHPLSATNSITPLRFQHLKANLQMAQLLVSEHAGEETLKAYEHVRWCNFKSLLRLFHLHKGEFAQADRKEIHQLLRDTYRSFHRSIPFRLYELRDWVGRQLH